MNLFYQERNHIYFLKQYAVILSPFLDTYVYCLLPNHFHLLVKIKSKRDVLDEASKVYSTVSKALWKKLKRSFMNYPLMEFKTFPAYLNFMNEPPESQSVRFSQLLECLPPFMESQLVSWILSDSFKRFFSGYARAINKQENTTGSLFQKNFRRILVDSEVYFTSLVWYIHNNSVHHGLCSSFKDYPWSFYNRILLPKRTKLKKDEVLNWFGGLDGYINFHNSAKVNWEQLNRVVIEEDALLV